MVLRRLLLMITAVALAASFIGCWGGPSGPTVHRVAVDEEIPLGEGWNETDSQLVARALVDDLLGQVWLDEWRESAGGKPRIVVGRVVNKSHDHIPTDTFLKDLEIDLINSGDVVFVASFSQRSQLSQEKLYQARNASLETQKTIGRELGADFLLTGQINSIVSRQEGLAVKYYQVELELLNVETGVKAWIGQKKIKKVIERSQWDL